MEEGELVLGRLEQKLDIIFDSLMALQEDIKVKDKQIMDLKYSLAARDKKIEEIEHRIDHNLRQNRCNRSLEDRLEKVEKQGRAEDPRDNPYCYECGYQSAWDVEDSVMTYTRLLYSSSNVSGGLDISTGLFTAGHSGTWAISSSIMSTQYSGDVNQVWIFKNQQKIGESEHYSYYVNSGQLGYVKSMGSRTLYLYLEKGDQVSLRAGSVYYLEDITVCFQYLKYL